MKPLPGRLVLANYPNTIEVPARFSDLDPMNHLNNVAIGNFYEEGRVAFNRMALSAPRTWTIRLLMVNVSVTYLKEGHYPGRMTVGTGVLKIGRSSYTLAQALFEDGECIGIADSTTVCAANGASAPLPQEFREALSRYYLNLQADISAVDG